jgi:hypothetical protein
MLIAAAPLAFSSGFAALRSLMRSRTMDRLDAGLS